MFILGALPIAVVWKMYRGPFSRASAHMSSTDHMLRQPISFEGRSTDAVDDGLAEVAKAA